jgi:hypothetical protein
MSSDEQSSNTGASEETKRKFREALERKKKNAAGRGEAHLNGESAVHDTHGRADHKRDFRRKSG